MYLLRLDDASEHWDKVKWHKIHDLCTAYGIRPLVAIIPHNEDTKQVRNPVDEEFWPTIRSWIDEGWTPSLHGYNHVQDSPHGGINPVNKRSEFAGKPIDVQREKIREGQRVLQREGITSRCFVAPAHTFDRNTLEALRLETDIRIVSDTVADDVYYQDGFYFIPQQSGAVRSLGLKLVTFCYHPNTMEDSSFDRLGEFLENNAGQFVSFDDIDLKHRSLSLKDRALRMAYFSRKKLAAWKNGK